MTTILKPGILVSLKTTVRGGVSYEREDLPPEKLADGREMARWKTTRIIDDAAEHKRATQARASARSIISKICTHTAFGLLCPEALEPDLNAAIEQARAVCDKFNAESNVMSVRIFAIKGRIASSDEEATRAIASEITELLEQMQQGIKDADPQKIREACNRARQMGGVLAPEQAEKVDKAVEVARSAARAIVRRVEKAGEDAKLVIQELTVAPIEVARFAFLDMEDGGSGDAEPENAMPAVSPQRFAGIDIDDAGAANGDAA